MTDNITITGDQESILAARAEIDVLFHFFFLLLPIFVHHFVWVLAAWFATPAATRAHLFTTLQCLGTHMATYFANAKDAAGLTVIWVFLISLFSVFPPAILFHNNIRSQYSGWSLGGIQGRLVRAAASSPFSPKPAPTTAALPYIRPASPDGDNKRPFLAKCFRAPS